jgi:hypothetical protein
MTIYDGVGVGGVIIILAAYLFLQLGKISVQDWRFSAANGSGALLILISLIFSFNLASFLIEIAWLLISIFGLFKALSSRQ